MKITAIRNLKMAFTPQVKTNLHRVRLHDADMGLVIKELCVPTDEAYLYYIICMEVQTDGFLRLDEIVKVGGITFSVGHLVEGWYQLSTSEIKAGKFEMWNAEMLIERINCNL